MNNDCRWGHFKQNVKLNKLLRAVLRRRKRGKKPTEALQQLSVPNNLPVRFAPQRINTLFFASVLCSLIRWDILWLDFCVRLQLYIKSLNVGRKTFHFNLVMLLNLRCCMHSAFFNQQGEQQQRTAKNRYAMLHFRNL